MRIAIVGAGIAGNAAAWALSTSTSHDITVYEKETRPGGHSATMDIEHNGRALSVDTGFIVYNELNYPNFVALLAHLGVATEASDMGFSVSSGGGKAEWAGRTTRMLDGLFARRRNIISPGHFMMIREMFRFNAEALADLAANRLGSISIGEYLSRGGFSDRFREEYLVPMGAAIWSMPPARLAEFPASSFLAFFSNHRLLHWNRPTWRTVTGGSRSYVERLIAPFRDRIRLGAGVASIRRHDLGVVITDEVGQSDHFDHVIIAAHSDQALAMLPDATVAERDILGAVKYRPNDVWLHCDEALMPRRKAAWAAWNVLRSSDPEADLTLTYWMNALQNIDKAHPVFVTLNPPQEPDPTKVFGRYSYSHPQFDAAAVEAQGRLPGIQGQRRTWFCGAWTGYGFHEDGLKSGLSAAEALGATVPWRAGLVAVPAE
jgi:predicted NAD/FAD-binding protein